MVGVVANVRHWGLDVEPRPEQYYCHLQEPTWSMSLAIRASGDPRRLTASIRQQLRRLDPLIPLGRVQTMEEVVSRSIASERSILILLGLFAAIALLLTAAGIWGTMAYLLSQRRREIGLRLALGATEGMLVRDAVARAMKLVTAGLIAGVALSLGLVRLTFNNALRSEPDRPFDVRRRGRTPGRCGVDGELLSGQAHHTLHAVCGPPAGVTKSGVPASCPLW